VLVLPPVKGLAMEWQAVTGAPISLVGGYCIVPDSAGHAVECDTYKALTFDEHLTLIRMDLLAAHKKGHFAPPTAAMAATISDLRPAAVLALSTRQSLLRRYLTAFFGPPTVRTGDMLGWRLKGLCGSGSAGPARQSPSRQCAHPQLALNPGAAGRSAWPDHGPGHRPLTARARI